ncbi:MAG: hypothetical protein RIR11_3368 [Bacteroidota bacterium]|jgi:DNA-3-methyladenine glycosylase II
MNLTEALEHLRQEPKMAELLDKVAMPPFNPSGRVYYDLLESIVSQQLSVKAATTIFNRFLNLFPDQYPHPEQVVVLSTEQLRAVGLSNQKAGYLKNVAEYAITYNFEHTDWAAMTDDEIIELLSKIKGVGKWTVQMVLMFTLGRLDIFPVDDLGIQQGIMFLFDFKEEGKPLKAKMEVLSQPWKPYRTLACRYLWRYKDTLKTQNV